MVIILGYSRFAIKCLKLLLKINEFPTYYHIGSINNAISTTDTSSDVLVNIWL